MVRSNIIEEKFAKPAIGAIVERVINGKKHIIIQERWKEKGNETNQKHKFRLLIQNFLVFLH